MLEHSSESQLRMFHHVKCNVPHITFECSRSSQTMFLCTILIDQNKLIGSETDVPVVKTKYSTLQFLMFQKFIRKSKHACESDVRFKNFNILNFKITFQIGPWDPWVLVCYTPRVQHIAYPLIQTGDAVVGPSSINPFGATFAHDLIQAYFFGVIIFKFAYWKFRIQADNLLKYVDDNLWCN